jgi:hypothetical protein
MAYAYPNFPTKKALKEAVKAGQRVIVRENTPFGQSDVTNGRTSVEGPHSPQPHKWYAGVEVKDGKVIKVS